MKLETDLVYGPVHSRRFGWDLGINLLPFNRKLCSFDCVYCQYGFTSPFHGGPFTFPTVDQILDAWNRQLKRCKEQNVRITHSTVSGNGEPTMHPHFDKIAYELKMWRDQNAPEIQLAVLSNGFRQHIKRIRNAIELFDEPIVKLDCAIPERLKKMDRPMTPFILDRLISALQMSKGIIIQTLFLQGWNDSDDDLTIWKNALKRIQPRSVQIYTVTRSTALDSVAPVSRSFLEQVATITSRELNLPVTAYW